MRHKLIGCVYHQIIPYHSSNQARMFFACGKELGIDAKELKERAKKKFEKDCFNKLTKEEMRWLINSLKDKYAEKMYKIQQHDKNRQEGTSLGASA